MGVLKNSWSNKAPGTDRIPYEFFKYAPDKFSSYLLEVQNVIFNSGKAPISFKEAIISLLYKKSDIRMISETVEVSSLKM